MEGQENELAVAEEYVDGETLEYYQWAMENNSVKLFICLLSLEVHCRYII
jgi:hypothetical protein